MTEPSTTSPAPQEAAPPKTADPAPDAVSKSNGESKKLVETAKAATKKPAKEKKPKAEAKPKATKPKATKPKAVKKAKAATQGDEVVEHIPLSQIVVREGQNPRREIKLTENDEFVQNIKMFGLMHAIGVAPQDDDGKYVLIYGERRFRALQVLKAKTIAAMICTDKTPEQQYVMRVAENHHRLSLTPVEEAVAFQNYITASGASGKDAAVIFNVSPGYLSQRLKILKMAPELQLALNKGDVNFTQARELARLDPKEQTRTLQQIAKDGGTRAVDITRQVETTRRAKRAQGEEGKKRGRPARTKENAPDIARQNLDNAIEALNNFAIEAKPKTELRTGLVTLYERFSNSRSESKKEQLRGAIKVMEWALGIRDDF